MGDFLGVGWAFPVSIDTRGRLALARGERDIEQAIRMILMTPLGQRIMRPEFGCRIHELAFEPNDGSTAGLAAHYVEQALSFWEPRIRVLEVRTSRSDDDPAVMLIDVRYEIKATNDRRSLVYPFYTIPGE
jgi:phage baseplate assembly protein W